MMWSMTQKASKLSLPINHLKNKDYSRYQVLELRFLSRTVQAGVGRESLTKPRQILE